MKVYNKLIIGENFSKSSLSYDSFAAVQNLAALKLCNFTLPFVKNNSLIADLGSGTSAISKNLFCDESFLAKKTKLLEIDLSQQMLKRWSQKPVDKIYPIKADIENLPLKSISIDMMISSFALQWIINFEKIFSDFNQVLKKGGILSFCLPTYASLEELKLISIKSGCNFHFNDLPKIEEIKLSFQKNSFVEEFYLSEKVLSDFQNPLQALKSLKMIGGNYADKQNFVSKKQLKSFNNFLGDKFTISWNLSYFILRKT